MRQLALLVEQGPDPERDGVVRWRRKDLKLRIEAMFGVVMQERTVGAQLAELDFGRRRCARNIRRLTRRPKRLSKKLRRPVASAIPAAAHGKPIEVWFQDEARVGQQGTLTRIWARRGSRPRGPRDRRY